MTAEDILINHRVLLDTIENSGNFPLNLTRDTHIKSAKDIKKAMIEFAKFHVENALNQASRSATLTGDGCYEWVDKDSILNAYPLENIK